MQVVPLSNRSTFDVTPRIVVQWFTRSHEALALIECEYELEAPRIVTDDPDRIDRFIETRCNSDEPNQWQPLLERASKCDVFRVLRIFAPVLVALEPVTAEASA